MGLKDEMSQVIKYLGFSIFIVIRPYIVPLNYFMDIYYQKYVRPIPSPQRNFGGLMSWQIKSHVSLDPAHGVGVHCVLIQSVYIYIYALMGRVWIMGPQHPLSPLPPPLGPLLAPHHRGPPPPHLPLPLARRTTSPPHEEVTTLASGRAVVRSPTVA